mgnify:CR=1 FL=1
MQKPAPFALLLIVVLAACQTTTPSWQKYIRGVSSAQSSIEYSVEPGGESKAAVVAKQMIDFSAFLSREIFSDTKAPGLRAVFYNNNESYSKSRPLDIESLAHFQLATATIHLPVTLQDEVWKHEVIHAILFAKQPNYPFWLQEGSALLLQRIKARPVCNSRLQLPAGLYLLRLNLLQNRPSLPVNQTSPALTDNHTAVYEATALAAYYVFYLWQQKKLLQTLRQSVDESRQPFLILYSGNYNELQTDEIKFYEWLETDQSVQAASGC